MDNQVGVLTCNLPLFDISVLNKLEAFRNYSFLLNDIKLNILTGMDLASRQSEAGFFCEHFV